MYMYALKYDVSHYLSLFLSLLSLPSVFRTSNESSRLGMTTKQFKKAGMNTHTCTCTNVCIHVHMSHTSKGSAVHI